MKTAGAFALGCLITSLVWYVATEGGNFGWPTHLTNHHVKEVHVVLGYAPGMKDPSSRFSGGYKTGHVICISVHDSQQYETAVQRLDEATELFRLVPLSELRQDPVKND